MVSVSFRTAFHSDSRRKIFVIPRDADRLQYWKSAILVYLAFADDFVQEVIMFFLLIVLLMMILVWKE